MKFQTKPTKGILAEWQKHYEELFGQHILCLQHRLHVSPLFTDDALVQLLNNLDRNDYHVNLLDHDVRREGKFGNLSGEAILRAVREGDIWINLRAPGRTNPAYWKLLDGIYNEFEDKIPGLKTFKKTLTILISSPKVLVNYHVDVPGQTLWQIRGHKRVYVYPAKAPFLTQNGIEKVTINEAHETDIIFQDWFDDYAVVKNLEPGEMLHWPLNCPHRIENHDCMNVSVTTEHWTSELRKIYAINYANGMLRKAGFNNLSQSTKGIDLWIKMGLSGLIKYSRIQKKAVKPYRIDFQVDPDFPRGVRDIRPYNLYK